MNLAILFNKKREGAFTVVEMLVVLAVMALILASAGGMFSFLKNIRATQALNQGGQAVKYRLEEARSLTIASKNAVAYGVHFESGKIVLFIGPTYTAGLATNQTTTLDPLVTISSINLTPAGSDVLFERVTGASNKSGTIVVSQVADTTRKITNTISLTGLVSMQ